MTAFDPTTLACTPNRALTLSEGLLASLTAGQGGDTAIWASQAVMPLAGLLYAAYRDSCGMEWVLDAARNTDCGAQADTPGWIDAAQRVADIPLLATALNRTAGLVGCQRDSVSMTVVDALAAWRPAGGAR